ncbi:apolipoprotein N-acyltransferase [Coleofasciculus sp.]|uniref:apolipoprotein N-acyltransferase n=1 Tax=Coleofasciculus sp. TaxID=3100458 RepID=UPI0039F9213B
MQIPKQLWRASPFLLSLLGGILMGLTPSPVEAWSLAWIALMPLWFLVVTRQSLRQTALSGFCWGIGYQGLALFWITGVHPMDWMGVPWLASLAIALFCWAFITLWGTVLVVLWAVGMTAFNSMLNRQGAKFKTLTRVLVGIALWCGLEAFWTLGDLNWTSLAYTQSPHNLWILHLGQISGPFTVTAAVVAVNGLIAEAGISYFSNRTKRVTDSNAKQKLMLALGLLIGFHLIGFGLYSRPLIQPTQAAFKVGIIQGNIPNTIKLYRDGLSRAIENYTNGYNALADQGVEAVLTPETALPFIWDEQDNQFRSPVPFYQYKLDRLKQAILEKGVLVWLGAFGEKGDSLTNSLFTITGTGETISRYNKVILVPLGEYIPFEELFGGLIDRLSPLDAHLAAGKPNQQFATPFGRAIAGICYESAFAYHFRHQAAREGEFILSASNNAHYSETMPAQHHAQDVMRAIETDRWAVRATNTGYSGIVDPHGRTLWLSGINTYQIHAATIYRRQTQTLYVRWGNWLTPTLLGLAIVAFIVSRLNLHQ